MTESTAMACLLPPSIFDYGTVGCPVPSAELKLVDGESLSLYLRRQIPSAYSCFSELTVPEAGYKSTNNPPQGELWIRGPSVCAGYCEHIHFTSKRIYRTHYLPSTRRQARAAHEGGVD